MCICVNCRHIDKCTAYLFIQKQHRQPINQPIKLYNFRPRDTVIKINIIKSSNKTNFDWDLVECLSFTEQPGKWLDNTIIKL